MADSLVLAILTPVSRATFSAIGAGGTAGVGAGVAAGMVALVVNVAAAAGAAGALRPDAT